MNTPYRTTLRGRIASAAERWGEMYRYRVPGRPNDVIYTNLTQLDPQRATKEDVDRIVGSDALTVDRCSQCDKRASETITVGEEPGCESATATLCKSCWDQANALWE
jgi:hypothetical protein